MKKPTMSIELRNDLIDAMRKTLMRVVKDGISDEELNYILLNMYDFLAESRNVDKKLLEELDLENKIEDMYYAS